MTEEELREMFAVLEAQGLQPMLCDTPVAVYDGRVPCGTPTLSYGEIVSMANSTPGCLVQKPIITAILTVAVIT